jgi:hypothetical protein
VLFEDRTPCHADFVDDDDGGEKKQNATGAVGLLQAINGPSPNQSSNKGDNKGEGRILKEVICFHAADFEKLKDILKVSKSKIMVFIKNMFQVGYLRATNDAMHPMGV